MLSNIHNIDLAIIVSYLVLCLVIGLWKVGKISTLKEYALGRHELSTGLLVATMFATNIGAGSTIGTIEKLYKLGMLYAIAVLLKPLFWLITAKIFANDIERFKRAGCVSVSGIMEVLYGKWGKWVTNFLSIIASIGILAVQITAIGYLSNYFLGVPNNVGIIIGFSIVVLYSFFGGVRGVILTDSFQSLVMFIGIPAACFAAYYELGGYEQLISNLPETHLSLNITSDNWPLFVSFIFYSLMPVSEGSFVQRFLMAKNREQLRHVLVSTALFSLPIMVMFCLIGFIVRVKAPEINPNTALFYLVSHYLPIGVSGLVITGILAAIMSTADSWLNTVSVLCARDIAKGIFPSLSDKAELLIARSSLVVISLFAVGLSMTGHDSLMGLMWFSENFWAPLVLVPLAAGFMRFKTTPKAFITVLLTGVASTFAGAYFAGEFATISLASGIIGSAIGFLFVYLTQKAKTPISFFKKKSFGNWRHLRPNNVLRLIRNTVGKHGKYYYHFGVFGLAYYFISSLTFTYLEGGIHDTLITMRLIALGLCFVLCSYEIYMSNYYKERYMPVYWYATLAYCLPFLSSFTFYISDVSFYWTVNFILSEFLLYVLAGFYPAIILSAIGIVSSFALFAYTGYQPILQVNDSAQELTMVCATCAMAVLYFLRQKSNMHEENMHSKLVYSSAIANEVREPMSEADQMADVVLRAFANNKSPSKIEDGDFEYIAKYASALKDSSARALSKIDRILTSIRVDISSADDTAMHDIDSCVGRALRSVLQKDRARIHVNTDNSFKFYGSSHFLSYAIANIVDNALRYSGENTKIEIWYDSHTLHIRDNGVGIPEDQLPYIFNAFDKSGSERGTGVGLAFCQRVMENLNGSIECYSKVGEYTEFVLKFSV